MRLFFEGESSHPGFMGCDPDNPEFDYSKWKLVGLKKSGEFWIVEHEDFREGFGRGCIYQHKIKEKPDGTFRIIAERHRRSRNDNWINLEP